MKPKVKTSITNLTVFDLTKFAQIIAALKSHIDSRGKSGTIVDAREHAKAVYHNGYRTSLIRALRVIRSRDAATYLTKIQSLHDELCTNFRARRSPQEFEALTRQIQGGMQAVYNLADRMNRRRDLMRMVLPPHDGSLPGTRPESDLPVNDSAPVDGDAPLVADGDTLEVQCNGMKCSLVDRPRLFELMAKMVKRPGQPVWYSALRSSRICYEHAEDSTIDGVVSQLRARLRTANMHSLAGAIQTKRSANGSYVTLNPSQPLRRRAAKAQPK